ncbi:MAG TPA: maleylpyruvate isomerase N-terminal domain-containing protein [Nocardioides sp.]|nr:maleylpyruvate isomerase N-terminal domain-containing protein [Nocardioides sp.]
MTAHHTRLSPDDYLEHLRAESARFRAVLTDCDPTSRVPACPDWDAADLLWHLATVQRWWAEVLEARPARPEEVEPPRPESYDDLLRTYDEWSAALTAALGGADPQEEAWNWSDDHTVGFILRRQAHEALVHRVDAEQAAGEASVLDARLATDGVHECLDVMYGGMPPWGSWEPGEGLVRVDVTDTGESFWLRFGIFSGTDPDSGTTYADEEDFHVVPAPDDTDVEPDLVVDGPAAALDLWLWNRSDDADISVAGDRGVLERFTAVVESPIN